jgi:hypothetical protein
MIRAKRRSRHAQRREVVYRPLPHNPHTLVFSDKNRALCVHQIWQAINRAKTWKEFFTLLPASERRAFKGLLVSEDEFRPQDRFSAESLPGYSDGDYPPWLQAEVNQHIPTVLLEEFGVAQTSTINGWFWEIPAEIEMGLVERLKAAGFAVEKREDWFFF